MRAINECHGDRFAFYHGDNIDVMEGLPDASVDMAVYSPPFADLFTYSDSPRDAGNCADDAEFMEHYRFMLERLFRVLRPGRKCLVHCCDIPSFKWKHGVMGFRDFPGDLLRAHQAAGFQYDGRITIWKDPVTEMQRTKAQGLLYLNVKTDAARVRTGNPDYLLQFIKPPGDGRDVVKVQHRPEDIPLPTWQEWASPVWMTIDQTNTLNVREGREESDERHMCPLQLDVIERAVRLWSAEGDVVFSPYGGIGSEGVGAMTHGRRYVGIELKESYFNLGCRNLQEIDAPRQAALFGMSAK